MNDIFQFAINKLNTLPNLQNNPLAMQALTIIQNRDSHAGEILANNICQNMGISPDDALRQIASKFNIK